MDHLSNTVVVSRLELAAIAMIRATHRSEWSAAITKLVQAYDLHDLTVSRKSAETLADDVADHYRQRLRDRHESFALIEAVFDPQRGEWQT